MNKCRTCNGGLLLNESQDRYVCEYCGNTFPLKEEDAHIQTLKERGAKLFRDCDFDAAKAVFQSVVSEATEDAETYWMLALCEYGIEYVDDPAKNKKIPTCHRTLYVSILNNDDYLNALDCADLLNKIYYEEEAKKIDLIQKNIHKEVEKSSPYDVFISYKEKDADGNRTKESDLGQDLYYKLKEEGYSTFFSRITLEEKAGMEYEPIIFSALNSAKIMIVIGFSREHYDAVWVKNEWGRYLERKKKNPRLILLPCYNSNSMDANELPEQLRVMQGRDLALTSINDIVAYVKEKFPKKSSASLKEKSASLGSAQQNYSAMAKRGWIYLEDGEYKKAQAFFNDSLNLNPEQGSVYWGLVLAKCNCRNNDLLIHLGIPIENMSEYKKAIRFSSKEEQEEYQRVNQGIKDKQNKFITNLKTYQNARAESIRETGVKKIRNNINMLELRLRDISGKIEENDKKAEAYRIDCANIVAEYDKRIENIKTSLNNAYTSARDCEQVNNTYKNNMLANLESKKNELASIKKEREAALNGSTSLHSLRQLYQEKEKLFSECENIKTQLSEQKEESLRLKSRINDSYEEIGRIIKEVEMGVYASAKALLGEE